METFTYTATKTVQMIEPNALKVMTSAVLSVGFFLFGDLHTQALYSILFLMTIDTVLGIMASVHEGHSISSARFSRAILKGIVYLTAISAGYHADGTVPFDIIQATMIAFVGTTEFISILENIGRMGYKTPKKLLNQLRDYQSNK
jgi:phage-related holin